MTILTLYQRLKEKGYEASGGVYPAGERLKWAIEFTKSRELPDYAAYEHNLKTELELDRREVFRVWYGEEAISSDFADNAERPRYFDALAAASHLHADGEIDTCIDYILREEDDTGNRDNSR